MPPRLATRPVITLNSVDLPDRSARSPRPRRPSAPVSSTLFSAVRPPNRTVTPLISSAARAGAHVAAQPVQLQVGEAAAPDLGVLLVEGQRRLLPRRRDQALRAGTAS